MRKYSVLFLFLSFLFVGCVSTDLGDYTSDSVVVERCAVVGKNLADVELLAGCDEDDLHSYFLTVKNISKKDIFIDWSKSLIFADGETSYTFEKGVKFGTAIDAPAENTRIEKGTSYANSIFSVKQVYFNGWSTSWQVGAFDNPETTVKICITDGTEDSYYTFNTYLSK